MSRQVDLKTARNLSIQKLTLGKLQQKSDDQLKKLGLSELDITKIRKGGRPPIPYETLCKLLSDNRFICCVCRDPQKSIIVHHITPWEECHSHDIENLAVLCLDHHSEAHTKKYLAKNLDKETLSSLKREWEHKVEKLDAERILQIASSSDYARWNFINHKRLFELIKTLGIDITKVSYFKTVKAMGFVDEYGTLLDNAQKGSSYMYEGGDGLRIYFYMKEVIDELLQKLVIKDLTNRLSKSEVSSFIDEGDIISVQGAHTFKKEHKKNSGTNQLCSGHRRANDVEINYIFDRWESTSCSAWADRLSGHKVATSIARVYNISRDGKKLILNCSVLLIGSHFENIRTRAYGYYGGYGMAEV